MPDKFRNKYRIESTRLQNWDYRSNAAYFVTICTSNHTHFFGSVDDDKMFLTPIGVIANVLWYEIKNHCNNIELGDFIVMPNHLHGIVIINENSNVNDVPNVPYFPDDPYVETLHATSLHTDHPDQPKNELMSSISPKPGSLSTIIRSYKSAVTKHANRLGFEFGWQPRFHDHIIRNDESYQLISNYIKTNIENWDKDKFNAH